MGYFIQNLFLFDVIEGLIIVFLVFGFVDSQFVPLNVKYPKIGIPKWIQFVLLCLCIPGLLFAIYNYNIRVFESSRDVIVAKRLMGAGKIEEGIKVLKLNYGRNTFIKDFFIFGDLEYIAYGDLKKYTQDQLNELYNFFSVESVAMSKYHPLNLRLYVARLLIILSKSRWNGDKLEKDDILLVRGIHEEILKSKLYLPDTDYYYSQVLVKSKDPKDQEESLNILKKFHEDFPRIVRAPWLIGVYLVEHGKEKEGLPYLQEAINTGPVFTTPQQAIGGINLFLKLGDPQTALKIGLMLEKETKNEPLVYLTIARVYQKMGDNKKALEYVLKAKQLYDIYATKKVDLTMEKEIMKTLNEVSQ